MEQYGKYSFEDNNTKIKVTTSNGQENVLFEDIASIGWEENFFDTTPHFGKGVILMIATFIFAIWIESWYVFGVGELIGIILVMYSKTTFFDTISVETKGGKIIYFNVPHGTATNEVDKIEEIKRKITGVKQ